MAIKVEDFYNTKFELEGEDAKEFEENNERELTMEEKEELDDALSYYEDTCRAE